MIRCMHWRLAMAIATMSRRDRFLRGTREHIRQSKKELEAGKPRVASGRKPTQPPTEYPVG